MYVVISVTIVVTVTITISPSWLVQDGMVPHWLLVYYFTSCTCVDNELMIPHGYSYDCLTSVCDV